MALVVKNLPANSGDIGDAGLIPGLGRFPGEENGNPLLYSCLENSMDRGAWWAIVHEVAQSCTWLKQLEPDILECEVKWALGSITVNKASGIPFELFQILKDDAVKMLHSICQQVWKTQQWPQDWKRSVFIPIPRKSNAKECSKYRTFALISHACKVML